MSFFGLGDCHQHPPRALDGWGLGQAPGPAAPTDAVSSVVQILSEVVRVGGRFIPETKAMRQRREQQAQIAAAQAAAAVRPPARVGMMLGALALAGVGLFVLSRVLGGKRVRRKTTRRRRRR